MTQPSDYSTLRREITERIKVLHSLLGLAVTLMMASLMFGFLLYQWGSPGSWQTFLLFTPIIFASLTFNYQANQLTLEAISYYLRDHGTDPELDSRWNKFWAEAKHSVQLVSFLKVLPLLLPQLLPIILIAWHGAWPASTIDQVLTSIDLALFALIIFNFRYKFKR